MEYVRQHHPIIDTVAEYLSSKTQNDDLPFFRVLASHFITKSLASLRISVAGPDHKAVPINQYTIALAPSGTGKGYSVNMLDNELLIPFNNTFLRDVWATLAQESIQERAAQRALATGKEYTEELEYMENESRRLGPFVHSFDSGTVPAVKQLRYNVLFHNLGAINLQIDEIGLNLTNNSELLSLFLELFDLGQAKDKLTKNTNENSRGIPLTGRSPANLLMFGAPSKLLDGGSTEDNFYSFLETGYARRCVFAWGQPNKSLSDIDADTLYERLLVRDREPEIQRWAEHLAALANPENANSTIGMNRSSSIHLLRYRLWCENRAQDFADHEELAKAEMVHRHFKMLKIAGAFAAVDGNPQVSIDNLNQAITLIEESGENFSKLFIRDRPYMRLAKYLSQAKQEVTQADLADELPFFKGSASARQDMLTMAAAWGYKNNIILKRATVDGIEFIRGESLQETNLDKLTLSYSNHVAYDYQNAQAPWNKLENMLKAPGYHWCNHALEDGHRREESIVSGFNLLVLDVDEGASLQQAMDVLDEYSYIIHTTKRHTEEANRFRIVLPMNFTLNLDSKDYTEFMRQVCSWLPLPLDESTFQRSRKWECFPGQVFKNEGTMFDVLPFIPKTSRNAKYREIAQSSGDTSKLERWFRTQIEEGAGRNNIVFRYGAVLLERGMPMDEVQDTLLAFNASLTEPLPRDELYSTVFLTLNKRSQE